jgi:hypothetical protein
MPRRLRSLVVAVIALVAVGAAVAWQTQATKEPAGELLPALRQTKTRFWKGNLHTHSFWSDGDDFPEMIADWYKRHSYDFLALSDHNILAEGQKWIDVKAGKTDRSLALKKYRARFGDAWVETRQVDDKLQARLKPLAEYRSVLEEPGRFLLIPAEEITHRFATKPVHVNAINLRDVIAPISGDSVSETIRVNLRAVEEQRKKTGRGMLAFLNHPNFYWSTNAEDLLVEELRFFEIFNGHPTVRNYGDKWHPGTETLWDIALALRLGKHKMPVLLGLATDDAHAYHVWGVGKVNPGRGWLMVRAPFLSAETIVQAIAAGDFYASSGVTLDEVQRQGDSLKLTIRGEAGVTYKTQFIATLQGTPLDSTPRTDENGRALEVTRIYHEGIGKVVAEMEGLTPSYKLTGQEMYVRARITSTKPHPNPYEKGDVEMAWTQPVVP